MLLSIEQYLLANKFYQRQLRHKYVHSSLPHPGLNLRMRAAVDALASDQCAVKARMRRAYHAAGTLAKCLSRERALLAAAIDRREGRHRRRGPRCLRLWPGAAAGVAELLATAAAELGRVIRNRVESVKWMPRGSVGGPATASEQGNRASHSTCRGPRPACVRWRSHRWGFLYCPAETRDGCRIGVDSTPGNPEGHARRVLKRINACPHR